MSKVKYLISFLFINFGGLAVGSYLMNNGPQSYWYANLAKAPWTPPGWVFGAAWTIIMICFSIYLMYLFTKSSNDKKFSLFVIQVVFNVSWNYIFFNRHQVLLGLIVITLLTALIFYFFFTYFKEQKTKSYLLMPYMIWLCIATSLNMYILVNN
jgi:tryptophan-rich sensory protein